MILCSAVWVCLPLAHLSMLSWVHQTATRKERNPSNIDECHSACCSTDLHLCLCHWFPAPTPTEGTKTCKCTSIKLSVFQASSFMWCVAHFTVRKHYTPKNIWPYYSDNTVRATDTAHSQCPKGRLFATEAVYYFPAESLWGEEAELAVSVSCT